MFIPRFPFSLPFSSRISVVLLSVPSGTFAPKVCFAPATPLFGAMPPNTPLQRLALLRSGVYFRFSYFGCRTQVGSHLQARVDNGADGVQRARHPRHCDRPGRQRPRRFPERAAEPRRRRRRGAACRREFSGSQIQGGACLERPRFDLQCFLRRLYSCIILRFPKILLYAFRRSVLDKFPIRGKLFTVLRHAVNLSCDFILHRSAIPSGAMASKWTWTLSRAKVR